VLKIIYLRSYENGGQAKVYLCNHLISFYDELYTIDSLWSDYHDYKYSIPQAHTNDILGFIGDACDKLPPNERKLEIKYILQRETNQRIIPERKNEKVKIFEVEICHATSPF
jgi:hypothetical protein